MNSWQSFAFAVGLSFVLSVPAPADDPKPIEITLLDLNFIVDDAATVLPQEKDKQFAPKDISKKLASCLKDNANLFARLESIRRAAQHVLRAEGGDIVRRAEATSVINVLKDGYVECGGQLGRTDPKEPGRSPEIANPNRSTTADKLDAGLRARVFARADLAYGIAVFTSANLLDEAVPAERKPCREFILEAIGMQSMPELSFTSAVLASAKDMSKGGETAEKHSLRMSELACSLQDAVHGSVSGDLLDRNLVHCFGIETVKRLRLNPPVAPKLIAPISADATKTIDVTLLDLNFIVDDAATVLPLEKDKQFDTKDISKKLAGCLRDNANIFARMESIRRAAQHILRAEGGDVDRRAEAAQVINVLKDCYTECGGQLGRTDPKEPGRSPEIQNGAKPVTADKLDATLRSRVFARADLAYGIALFTAANLLDEVVPADRKLCREFLLEAIGMQQMPELSFVSAVLASAKDQSKGGETADKHDLRVREIHRHLQDAVNGSAPSDLIDRNLVHCFGIETVKKLRQNSPLGSK